jgi:hypothetical protein
MKQVQVVLFIALSIFALSCGNNKSDSDKETTDSTKQVVEKVKIDTLLTDIAYLIAGKPTIKHFNPIQEKDFYIEHKTFVNDTWEYVEDSMIMPLRTWLNEEKIVEKTDTGTLFYPFSGPDFLYANEFYPYCTDYIMLGLEKLGTVANPDSLTEKLQKQYFTGIQKSLRYLNMAGYFVTQHMGSDFSRFTLDGVVHMIMYFMAKTDHQIIAVEYIELNKDGTYKLVEHKKSKETVIGLKIRFCDDQQTEEKSLYYFSIDASDENLETTTELNSFVRSFDNMHSYFKAASYILANPNFNIIRKIVTDKSKKIIQDDTGVPYRYFEDEVFDVKLYGVYSRTLDELKWGYQTDLKKALADNGDHTPLPFKISYNGRFGEGVMIYAKRK